MYVLRDEITNEIMLALDMPQEGFEFIKESEQEYIDWLASEKAKIEAANKLGFHSKDHENISKGFIQELANHFVKDATITKELKDSAQNVIDNVT